MKVIIAPNQCLRAKTKSVKKISPSLLEIIKQMVKLTKTYTDPEGVGLASTQIGQIEQYFVMKLPSGKFKVYFNPKIISFSKKTKVFFEGCLSIPDYYGEITRPIAVKVSYLDEDGKEIKESLRGLLAWFFQHEYDHLHGKLFVDHVLTQKSRIFKVTGKDAAGSDIFEEIEI